MKLNRHVARYDPSLKKVKKLRYRHSNILERDIETYNPFLWTPIPSGMTVVNNEVLDLSVVISGDKDLH